ncbi:MAG: hypothetical protein IT494_00440, partial [Gammaproteobacteria bacterium]|nr:hypothetical protein [Gammaproteobacteria bacterium]
MKTLKFIATAAAVAAFSGPAFADCTSNQIMDAALGELLRNNTVCGIPGSGYSGDEDDRW